MKKINKSKAILFSILSLFIRKTVALAEQNKAEQLTPLQKSQISWALKILKETNTITAPDNNKCIQFNQDILQTLEDQGLLEKGRTRPQTFCGDA